MSFDPFEARLHFLQLLRKLNASQPSIQKVVAYAVRYGSRCGEDLWECVLEESAKGTLNTRINILYFLDTLADVSTSLGPPDAPYLALIARDLGELVGRVVPPTREGVLNLRSAKQILDSWRLRRIIDPGIVDAALMRLDERKIDTSLTKRTREEAFSRNDILRRMEEDRERHKRLRERIWILPIPPLAGPASSSNRTRPPQASSTTPAAATGAPSGATAFPSPSPSSPYTPASPSGRRPPAASVSGSGSIPAAGSGAAILGAALPLSSSTGSDSSGKMPPPPVPTKLERGDGKQENDRPAAGPVAEDVEAGTEASCPKSALEVEFEQLWESAGALEEEDLERMRENAVLAGLLPARKVS